MVLRKALLIPDRVYAWAVDGYPAVSAYLRIKAGKSRAGRGDYKRAMPFYTLRFDNLDSALGILLGTDDMLEAAIAGYIASMLLLETDPVFYISYDGVYTTCLLYTSGHF